ncbi:MAG: helix-hairpin-helix domain-containing protein [Candidatus Accumulibacter sp. UW20]|jgi:DNA-binding helix-hairpin-helix protein with protein kinase domain
MSKTLLTANGSLIQVGRELGKGGEGSVFEVPALAGQVAKLYHRLPDAKKQAKLKFMASTVDQQLLSYVAWPQETLHSSRGGPVVGFLMPKVMGRDPVHMVYSPAHRRQERPKATWNFLLFVARNTAAAFEALHSHGHVLGDVNQGNVLVGSDSKVVLIDSDSFQVNARGTLHLCEVGVSHFTPPELQGLSSFDGFTRTANHDNFGLALLIFHLLFGGRHPYSGVPLKSGVGDTLESDIKAYRYAYARDSQSRGIGPPPRSIPLSIVPDAMETMFHLAFTEKGAAGSRPTSQQWLTALDAVRGRLKPCGASSMHLYPDHLATCPWCTLEQQGAIYFIDLGVTYTGTASGFVLAQVWALIESVQAPPPVSVPSVDISGLSAQPLPSNITSEGTITFYRLLVVGIVIAVAVAVPNVWFLCLIAGFFGWMMAGSAGSSERIAECNRRKAIQQSAKQEYDQLVKQAKKEAGPEGFSAKRSDLVKLRNEYQSLQQTEKQEMDKLHSTAEERQKQKFLDGCFIDSANITGVGTARKAALRSFGIETAADVSRSRVLQVRGFGESLTRAVVDWKASCERRFTFNPTNAVSEADKNAVRTKFGVRKVALEASLGAGSRQLQQFQQHATARAAALQPKLEEVALRLAKAEKDLSVL